ncbi:Contactin [Folsomia candida]|uniref:Contactin n=1 Tax=Folsomia candida TaxID=158441 RepID=A0A226D4J7_FOLCA|nr:Contactin [Folsomia candida]
MTSLTTLGLIYFCSICMTNGQSAPPDDNPLQTNSTLENTNKNHSIIVIQVEKDFENSDDTTKIPRGPFFIEEPTTFGIPDVSYEWFKNGVKINTETLPPEDIGRYVVQANVLKITKLDEERDPGMYQCRASNAVGVRFSSAQLSIFIDPKAVQSGGTLKTISSLQDALNIFDLFF